VEGRGEAVPAQGLRENPRGEQRTAEMMTFQVINAGEPPLTDGAAEVFAGGGLHGETRLGW
jgi:hypothetical protein